MLMNKLNHNSDKLFHLLISLSGYLLHGKLFSRDDPFSILQACLSLGELVESKMVSAALQILKPLCMELVSAPSSKTLLAVIRQLHSLEAETIQQLQPFVVFSLRTTLLMCVEKSLSQQLLTETCQAISLLLQKSRLQNTGVFMDLFSQLSNLMFSGSSSVEGSQRCLSEEEKLAVIEALCALISSCEQEVLHSIYLPTNIVGLGSLVSQLVAVVPDTKVSRSLRHEAMNALMILMQQRTYTTTENCWHHGNRFAGLMPGISAAMFKVLLGDSKQGHQIFSNALEVWTEVICLTMADESLLLEQNHGYAWIGELKMKDTHKALIAHRDEKWIKATVPNVELMVKEMSKLKKHYHWKFRKQLVSWADRLLNQCHKSLHGCTSTFLEVLVLLMTDTYTQVSELAEAALKKYRDKQGSMNENQNLNGILKESLFALLTSLPRRMEMEDEEEKYAMVGLLISYISLLGKDMSALLLSQSHCRRLSRVLVQVLELDVTDQKILEESGMGARGMTSVNKFMQQVGVMTPRKVFVHFRDEMVKSGLLKACQLLGQYGDLALLMDTFLELYRESTAHQLACVVIINEILTGHSKKEVTEEGLQSFESSQEQAVRLLLDEYLSNESMSLCDSERMSTLSPMSSPSSSVSLYVMVDSGDGQMVKKRNQAIMLTSLYLEGVGVCAKVLGKRFLPLLADVLYPVTEKVGSEISAVSSTAYLTLCHLAEASGFRSVDDLLQSNADYMVSSISQRLWRSHFHEKAPGVLGVMLRLCDTDILSLVWDSLLQILDTLDEHHMEHAMIFVPVLHQLTLAVARWFPSQKETRPLQSCKHQAKLDPAGVTQMLLDRRKLRLVAEAFDVEPETDDTGDIAERMARLSEEARISKEEAEVEEMKRREEEDLEKEPPLHVKAVKEVLLRVRHLVSSSNHRLALLALDVIAQGCSDLADHENDLLPIVHQLWPSFKQRFQDTEKQVAIKAVKTLQRLCECCGDFIRQRVEKDVLPSLKAFLHNQAKTSHGCRSSYLYTVNYKLQRTLLTTLGDMACKLGLDGMALEAVLHCCLPYLSQHQPSELQQVCMESIQQMMVCDGDVVWWGMSGLSTPSLPSPPSSHFKPITVFKSDTNEYSTNVSLLLQSLNSHEDRGS